MITDQQAKLLDKLVNKDKMSVKTAAAKIGGLIFFMALHLFSGELDLYPDGIRNRSLH